MLNFPLFILLLFRVTLLKFTDLEESQTIKDLTSINPLLGKLYIHAKFQTQLTQPFKIDPKEDKYWWKHFEYRLKCKTHLFERRQNEIQLDVLE